MSLDNQRINEADLLDIVASFNQQKIAVIGDLMVDKYIIGEVNRISPEAPVPVLLVSNEEYKPGGAANVAKNIVALGAKVFLYGVLGDDQTGLKFTFDLQREGISPDDILLIPGRTSTLKCRVIAQNQQICRLDYETDDGLDAVNIEQLIKKFSLRSNEFSAITVSDYNKGLICPFLMSEISFLAQKKHIPILANPKPINIDLYRNFDLITLNRSEALSVLGNINAKNIDNVMLVQKLHNITESKYTIMTVGQEGIYVCWENNTAHFPGLKVEVYDVTGAGDTVNSILTLSLAAGADIVQAIALANIAGALVVRKRGVATINQLELVEAIKSLKNIVFKVF